MIQAVGGGYDANFLPGHELPDAGRRTRDVEADYAPLRQGEGPVRHLTHFSLAMSASRRFCRWVAWNVDGNGLQQLSRTGIEFKRDPAYRAEHQVDDDLYANNRLDRGHIARRADLLWGTREEAQRANTDSFLFTNIAPQLDDFNQSVKHGLWGQLEDAIYEGVSVDDLRLSVVGGPIFKRNDLEYRGVLVPRSYWKAIAYVEDETLKAKAYVLTQDDLEGKLESLGLEPFNLYQVAIRELGAMTGLDYGPLITADTMAPSDPRRAGRHRARRSARAQRSSARRAAAGAGARRARGASRRSPARSDPCARSRPPASRRLRFAGRCGTPAGMWMKSPASTTAWCSSAAPPELAGAADHVDRGLVIVVQMGHGPPTGREAQPVQAERLRAGVLVGDPGGVFQSLAPGVRRTRSHHGAVARLHGHMRPDGGCTVGIPDQSRRSPSARRTGP